MSDQSFFASHLLRLITRIGRGQTVLLITAISVVISVVITWASVSLLAPAQHNMTFALKMATTVPLIAAPVTSWPLMGLFLKVHQLEAQMRRLALIDSLTGLANRRHFLEQAETHLVQAIRTQHPVSVIMIDIDHFKRINDTFGHAAGDNILKQFSSHLQQLCRDSDLVGRLGGEEFAVLLPDTDCEAAAQFCQRLHQEIHGLSLSENDQPVSITVSAGVKCFSGQRSSVTPLSLDRLLSEADRALYQAKAAGRDQTRIA